jgi:A/G-specific adenine glycosylase
MLQQTQIATVLDRGYYARWMDRFPDAPALAAASEHEVLRAWEGLGYYRRARFLHQLAKTVMADHAGVFPREAAMIRTLPGVGRYTAGAVASFAFDAPEPIVDGNVARVLSRLANDATPVDSTAGQAKLWEHAQLLVQSAESARKLNSALMELGQRICRTGTPACGECPVKSFYRAAEPASLPVKAKRVSITEVTEHVFFHRTDAGVLLQQETGRRRTGLWKLPALPPLQKLPPVLHKAHYTITRYRVTLWVHEAPPGRTLKAIQMDRALRLVSDDELAGLPMPSPYRKALNAVLATTHFALEA